MDVVQSQTTKMEAVGSSIRRVDGVEKVTGKASYAGDLRVPGMAYAKVLRSPLPHARVRRIDAESAKSLSGVLAVLTRENLDVAFPCYGAYVKDQPLVAIDKVRYAGDVVAAVAATEEMIAEDALKSIEIEYEELPAVFTVEQALEPGAPLVHERLDGAKAPRYGRGGSHIAHERSNICLHFRYSRATSMKGFATLMLFSRTPSPFRARSTIRWNRMSRWLNSTARP
jgi:CO/xanthine dehydrogenase Mo-binding subunit